MAAGPQPQIFTLGARGSEIMERRLRSEWIKEIKTVLKEVRGETKEAESFRGTEQGWVE